MRIYINDLFTNEKFDLGQFFSRLDEVAGKYKIDRLQLAPNEKIFEFISIIDFKNKGNEILNQVKVALLNKVIQIDDNAKIKNILKDIMMTQLKEVTAEFIEPPKNKKYYYWKNMTKDIKNT